MARPRKTSSDQDTQRDDTIQQAIVFDEARVSDRVELSTGTVPPRPSGNRIILPRGGKPPIAEEEPRGRFEALEAEGELPGWEDDENEPDSSGHRRGNPETLGNRKKPRLTATVVLGLAVLMGVYGYVFGLPSFLDRMVAAHGNLNPGPRVVGTKAVVSLQPFFLPRGTNVGRSHLVSLEMVVDGSLLPAVEEQLPAVRGIIYSSLRKQGKEDPLSKEYFRRISEQVNRRLGLNAVIEVRARKLS